MGEGDCAPAALLERERAPASLPERKDPVSESHAIRLSFEQAGTVLVLAVLGAACAIALLACWPAHWADVVADHVNKVAGALLSFVGALAGVLGLSWGRGHLDERLKT